MTRTIAAILLAGAALSLASCGKRAEPTMPTAEDNAELANAGAMDTSPDSLVGDNATLGNGEDADDDDDLGNGT